MTFTHPLNALQYFKISVQDETRTHTTEWSLPPQSSASTNSATWTSLAVGFLLQS